MPRIIPIKDLKNASAVSTLCQQSDEPIFITKNGYGDMVIMSVDAYEKHMMMQDVYQKLAASQVDIEAGNTFNAKEALKEVRKKYGI